jgi:hypothetical protein
MHDDQGRHTGTNALISEPPRTVILTIARRARFRGRLLGCAGDRQMPAAANGHEPKPETEERAGNRERGRIAFRGKTADLREDEALQHRLLAIGKL